MKKFDPEIQLVKPLVGKYECRNDEPPVKSVILSNFGHVSKSMRGIYDPRWYLECPFYCKP